jgi:large subunit ribosomal protein L9
MKVLLKQDVANLGYAGEVMNVADGYGRNYLIPQGLAVKATAGVLKDAANWRERAAARMAELRQEHEALANRIGGLRLSFIARAGERGKLYGSITSQDITDRLNKELGTEVDRRNIVGAPLRQIGEHQISVRLSRDYQPLITVDIHPEAPVGRMAAAKAKVQPAAEAELLDEPAAMDEAAAEPEVVDELYVAAAEDLDEEWEELVDEEAEETA